MTFITPPTSTQLPPAELWRREVESITEDARRIMRRVEESQKIARGNKIAALVAATPEGSPVPGTTMSKEQAEAWLAMVGAVRDFLEQEIYPDFTISDGLYAIWPEVVSEEPAA